MADEAVSDKKPEVPRVVNRMPADELAQFILDYCDGRVFTSNMVSNADMLGLVFMPLALGALSGFAKEEIDKIGVIWNPRGADQAPRSVNGMPMFTACRIMHKDDWAQAVEAINVELERRKKAKARLEESLNKSRSDDEDK